MLFSVSDVGERKWPRSLDGVVAGVDKVDSGATVFSGRSSLLSGGPGFRCFGGDSLTSGFEESCLVGVGLGVRVGLGAVGITGETFSVICPPDDGDRTIAMFPLVELKEGLDSWGFSLGLRIVALGTGDFLEGSVLLREIPILGLPGIDLFEDTERFRLMPPWLRSVSAAALAFDGVLLTPIIDF